MNPLMTIY